MPSTKAKAMIITAGAVAMGAGIVLVSSSSKAATGKGPKPAKATKVSTTDSTPAPSSPSSPSSPAAQEPKVETKQPPPGGQALPPSAAPVTYPPVVPNTPPVTVRPDDPQHLANELALHLATLQLALKSAKAAKGHENKTLVKTFQHRTGLTEDGEAGPATFIMMARQGAGTLPLVMYWPKKANADTVLAYRTGLRAVADAAPEPVKSSLKASADRERGQGGINGPLAPAVPGAVEITP